MCFTAPSKINMHIADKDIVCYKEMFCQEKVYSPAWYQFWKPKVTKVIRFCSVVQGYKYTPYEKNPTVPLAPSIMYLGNRQGKVLIITKGYHSYDQNTTTKGPRWDTHKRVECIIPKGSIYYFYKGCFVSSDIIVTDKILNYE